MAISPQDASIDLQAKQDSKKPVPSVTEDFDTKVKRVHQVLQQEADDAAGQAIGR